MQLYYQKGKGIILPWYELMKQWCFSGAKLPSSKYSQTDLLIFFFFTFTFYATFPFPKIDLQWILKGIYSYTF